MSVTRDMDPEFGQEGVVVSSSRTRVLRAGFANIILFIVAVVLVLLNQTMANAGVSALVRSFVLVGTGLAGLKTYACSLSSLHVRQWRALVLVGPFSEHTIEIRDIVGYEVGGIPSSQIVTLKIRVRSSVWPRFRFFLAVSTNAGGYAPTKARLETLMEGVLRRRPGDSDRG